MSHLSIYFSVTRSGGYMARGRFGTGGLATSVEPIIKLWVLRVIIPLGYSKEFIDEIDGMSTSSLVETLELDYLSELADEGLPKDAIKRELVELYEKYEHLADELNPPAHLVNNISKIAELVGLSEVESRILEFAIIVHNEQVLEEATDQLGNISTSKVISALSTILDLPLDEVKYALSVNSKLFKSGLLSIDRRGTDYIKGKLDLLGEGFLDIVYSHEIEPVDFLKFMVRKMNKASLQIDDYSHIQQDLDILIPYLEKSLSEKRTGVNIFVYGIPGTGKTELVKMLAKHLELEAYEVANEDASGDPIKGEHRLRAYNASQNFIDTNNSLIAFDEVEDIFDDGVFFLGMRSTAEKHKAWINRILEENKVPTFWISNSVHCLDAAFVRRFDMIVHLKVPTASKRENMLEEHCGDFLDKDTIKNIASSKYLAPAVITRAADVVKNVADGLEGQDVAKAFVHIVNNTLTSQGHRPIPKVSNTVNSEIYDPDLINTTYDLKSVREGLEHAQSGRICLYGPPGTGKTAFGKWLSDELDKDLLLKRGSDLISMWVGGTEKNIAEAFEEANDTQSILLIDEVDSFLQDRRSAQNSWEVTGVNELLTQMESFEGIFITSTNLIDNLDQAALRRFDIKLLFDYMKPQQIETLVAKYCQYLDIALPTPKSMLSIMSVNNATPGDFAAVVRKSRLYPVSNGDEYVKQIIEDVLVKESVKRNIGFVH